LALSPTVSPAIARQPAKRARRGRNVMNTETVAFHTAPWPGQGSYLVIGAGRNCK
jgi:hypothetical protein